jgi:hypothetical protein
MVERETATAHTDLRTEVFGATVQRSDLTAPFTLWVRIMS